MSGVSLAAGVSAVNPAVATEAGKLINTAALTVTSTGGSYTPNAATAGNGVFMTLTENVTVDPPTGSTSAYREFTMSFKQTGANTYTVTFNGFSIVGSTPVMPTGDGAILTVTVWRAGGSGTWNLLGVGEPSYLWTQLPSATGRTGLKVYVTDVGVGGSYWYSDGTRWRAVGGQVVLKHLNTQPANTASAETKYTGATTTILANLLGTGDIVRVLLGINKSGESETMTVILRMGTNDSTADAQLIASAPFSTVTNNTMTTTFEFRIATAITAQNRGATTVANVNNLGGTGTTVSSAPITITNVNTLQYLNIFSSKSAGVETGTLTELTVTLLTVGP